MSRFLLLFLFLLWMAWVPGDPVSPREMTLELTVFLGFFALIVLVSAGVRTALDARDMFTKLCSIGLAAFIGFQALVNIGGITRALPMTGITLPFVSHGGFSLITSFVMLGMLMAFSHRNAMDRAQAVPTDLP